MSIKASVQHRDPAHFKARGLRDYFIYRDLGIAEASNGRIVAQINKASRALTEEGELHHHVLTHQWNLVLQGSAVMKFEGTGMVQIDEGCAFYMPPNIKHTFVSCTDNFITMEICTPADFGTEEDDPSTYHEDADVPARISIQNAEDGVFEIQGLRNYFSYRDLGITKATNGAILAHIIRAEHAVTEPSDRHYHVLDDQFVYVLKGSAEMLFEDGQQCRFEADSCYYQPSEIKHTFLSCSEDFMALEVCLPAKFETITT